MRYYRDICLLQPPVRLALGFADSRVKTSAGHTVDGGHYRHCERTRPKVEAKSPKAILHISRVEA